MSKEIKRGIYSIEDPREALSSFIISSVTGEDLEVELGVDGSNPENISYLGKIVLRAISESLVDGDEVHGIISYQFDCEATPVGEEPKPATAIFNLPLETQKLIL
jgi:hypothetical protein